MEEAGGFPKEQEEHMDIREQITACMEETIAKVFRRDREEIAAHHELRFKEDFNANSKHYFPILSALSDEFDVEIDYHQFQFHATTVETAIEYAIEEYYEQAEDDE